MNKAPEAAPDKQGAPPTPFYNRPVFWALLIFLIGAAMGGLFFQQKTVVVQNVPAAPVAPPPLPDNSSAVVESVIAGQKARNNSLQEEINRLTALLNAEPCQLREALGLPPTAVPLPPQAGKSSGPGAPGGKASGPDAPGTPGDKASGPDGAGSPGSNKSDADKSDPAKGDPDKTADAGDPKAPKSDVPSPRTVGDLMEQSTVFIIALDGDSAQTGTGFFVAPGIIATNRHVVGSPKAKILVTNKVLGSISPAQIMAISPVESRDYALLRLVEPDKANLAPVLKISEDVHRTDKVSAWGFPGAVTSDDPNFRALMNGDAKASPEVVYSEGVVSVILQQKPEIIVHTALISQGNSGGPLVNELGEVVGINTMIALDSKSYRQSGLSLAANDLMAFLRDNGVSPVTAQPTPAP